MSTDPITLSVYAVHYRSEEKLRRFLESFSRHRPSISHEVILIDNGGKKDEISELAGKYSEWLKVLHSPKNIGYGKAQNLAVEHARGEYVFICNPDIEFQDDSIERMVRFAEENINVGVVGPLLLYPDGGYQDSCRRFPGFLDLVAHRLSFLKFFKKRRRHYLMRDIDLTQPSKVEWLVGAAMLMKRKRFLELEGFDPRFFLFLEDMDLCRRMGQKGLDVWFYPHSSFLHTRERLSERGWWVFTRAFWIHFASAIKYFIKWMGRPIGKS